MYKSWIWAVFVAFDQLGNALCGGHPDVTVSARLWHLDQMRGVRWMRWVRRAVDAAFAPVDGSLHCFQAYMREGGFTERSRRGNDVALFFLTWLVLVFVPVLFLVNCLRWLVGRFR